MARRWNIDRLIRSPGLSPSDNMHQLMETRLKCEKTWTQQA